MASINSVTLVGNLTADPELRTFENGGSICSLRIAVNGGYVDRSTRQFVDQVSYFDVDVSNGQAAACAQYLEKGRQVAVMGRLHQNRWETDEGNRQRVLVKATTVQFLGGPRQDDSSDAPELPADEPAAEPTAAPKPKPAAKAKPKPKATVPANAPVGDDDIPF